MRNDWSTDVFPNVCPLGRSENSRHFEREHRLSETDQIGVTVRELRKLFQDRGSRKQERSPTSVTGGVNYK
jgi:hypothetical protein